MISLFNLCINLIETFMTSYFAVHYLTKNNRYKVSYFIILWLIVFAEVTIANITGSSYLVDSGLPIITIFIFTIYFVKGSTVAKMLISIFTYIALFVCNMLTLFIFSLISMQSLNEMILSNIFPYAILFSKIAYFMLIILILKYRKRNDYWIANEWFILVPTCVMSMVILINLSELLFTGIINYNLLYISLYSLLGFSVFLYFFFIKIQKESESKTRQLLEIQQLRYQKENMEDIKLLNEEIRKIKHDMKHKIEYISECLNNDNQNEVRNILNLTYEELNKVPLVQYSKNESLNYILQSKSKIAHQHKISLRCEVTYDMVNIDNNDLIVLLGNLLDNAIENSMPGESVSLEIRELKGYLKIVIKNAVHSDVNINVTSKKDKRNHGFGLKSVKEIVNKYDGELTHEIQDNEFVSIVLLKLN